MTLLILIISLALIFDYINGFHDAANSIATVVSTKVLTPFQAVAWAAIFNFAAFFIFSDHHVANTIAKTVHIEFVTLPVILCGLISAIIWNLITWWYGIPSSSSHALIGGFSGAAIAYSGTFDSIDASKISKVVLFIFLAPLIGMIIAYFIAVVTSSTHFWRKIITIVIALSLTLIIIPFTLTIKIGIAVVGLLFLAYYFYDYYKKGSNFFRTSKMFKRLQLVSSAAFSIGHGGNDAQKVMGIITVALLSTGEIDSLSDMPNWVPLACYLAMGLGTLSGGWKIIKTMGTKITKVSSLEGVSAETAGALTLFMTERLGIPVSTTHTITGSIIGVGATKRMSAVRWGVTINLLWAWVITIPFTGILALICFYILKLFMPV